jgi:hypothetical protein
MEHKNDLSKKLQNLKNKESRLEQMKARQEIELQNAQKLFLQRTADLEIHIHRFFRREELKQHYQIVTENFPAVTLIQFTHGECLLFFVEAQNLDSDIFTLHSGYILDKDHREEIFDFDDSEILEIPVKDIDNNQFGELENFLDRVVSRHIAFLEKSLEKGYIRRTLHSTIKNPWQL